MAPRKGKSNNRKALSLVQRRKELLAGAVRSKAVADKERHKKKTERLAVARRASARLYDRPELRTLLVGEGDFSFTRALVRRWDAARAARGEAVAAAEDLVGFNVVATCLDSKEELQAKYPGVGEVVREIKGHGVTVHTGIDATKLLDSKRVVRSLSEMVGPRRGGGGGGDDDEEEEEEEQGEEALTKLGFDLIVFNFPHLGCGVRDKEEHAKEHRVMLQRFFASACALLAPRGQIHVTVKTGEPYDSWRVPGLATETGLLKVHSIMPFDPDNFDGYAHRRTLGAPEKDLPANADVQGEAKGAQTVVLVATTPADKSRKPAPKPKDAQKLRGLKGKELRRKLAVQGRNRLDSDEEEGDFEVKSSKKPDILARR